MLSKQKLPVNGRENDVLTYGNGRVAVVFTGTISVVFHLTLTLIITLTTYVRCAVTALEDVVGH